MPEPDPQPPQPRPISPALWLQMLLPSVLVLSTLAFARMFENASLGSLCAMIYSIWVFAFYLCFRFGFMLER